MAASITVQGLSHRYGRADRRALDDVSFAVAPGERVGLLGPNGAGKSTLMRILCGYLTVDAAERVEVAGFDVRRDSLAVRERVGYLPEHVPLYPELRVEEHLAFRASIKAVPRRERGRDIASVAERTGITDKLRTPIGQLSRGYRQRVGIADALLGSPPLVVLDEPTVGLDPNQVQGIRAMLRELGGQQTLVFSSHILAEVEMLCDRVVILSHGRVVADEALQDALRSSRVIVRWRADPAQSRAIVERVGASLEVELQAEVEALDDDRTQASIEVPASLLRDPEPLLAAIGRCSVTAGLPIVRLEPGRTRLEERFAEVTGARRAS